MARASTDNHYKLKPIDIKDIERRGKYDNQVAKFNSWFDKFEDLLTSRKGNWEKLLGLIENWEKVTIKNHMEFTNSLDGATCKPMKEQSETNSQHLSCYLRTCTDGELHARVIQTVYEEVELTREVIYKGRNRNPNRLIGLKTYSLSPSKKTSEGNKIDFGGQKRRRDDGYHGHLGVGDPAGRGYDQQGLDW